jgi:hypothetical protein
MSDIQELVKRARELAALADKAIPGPWLVTVNANYLQAAPNMARLLAEMADELEKKVETLKKITAAAGGMPPMFVSGNVPDRVIMLRRAAVVQLTDGAEGRWGTDHKALAMAAYEAGWDDAMMYYEVKK